MRLDDRPHELTERPTIIVYRRFESKLLRRVRGTLAL